MGSKCTNAVSSKFIIHSYYLGKGYKIEFHEGKPLPEYNMKPKEIPNTDNKQGLVVDFELDLKVLKKVTLKCEDILDSLENLIPLLPPTGTIEFIGHKSDKKTVIRKILKNEDGMNTYLIRMTDKPFIKPIIFGFDNGEMKCDVALTYEADLSKHPDIIAFANMSPINVQSSTPTQGFFQGVIQFFKNYMNKVYLPSFKRKMDAINSDVLTGLVGAVASAHINIVFDGQAKNICRNSEFVDFVKQVTYDNLIKWSKENPDDLQKLCEFFKDVVTARSKLDKEKINISKKYKTTSFVDLPEKYNKAIGKEHLELLIGEGDSSAAGLNAGRDPTFQAVFPIRGKLPNAFSTPKEKFLQNAEVQAILAIIDAGYGKNFDIEKCKFEKIVIFADADPDGYHIRTLLLKFFLVYCRPLVDDGRVYIGLSPLYHVDKGKKNWQYFIDRDDFNKYVMNQFFKNNNVDHANSKQTFSRAELMSLITNNRFYKEHLETIATNHGIHPILLEDIMIIRNEPFNRIKSLIEKKYKYLTVSLRNDRIIIDGIAYDQSHTIILNDFLVNACNLILPNIDNSEKRYIINGRTSGLYELLSLYSDSEPKNIERAKGLGALSPFELGYSSLRPENRKLLRYTADDIVGEIEEMRKINDDKYELIKGVDMSLYDF